MLSLIRSHTLAALSRAGATFFVDSVLLFSDISDHRDLENLSGGVPDIIATDDSLKGLINVGIDTMNDDIVRLSDIDVGRRPFWHGTISRKTACTHVGPWRLEWVEFYPCASVQDNR